MQLSEEQILALAPDEASKKAGRDLAVPGKWVSKGINEKALWGECQGSGSKPYQTQVDLVSIAFKCSCPSRKFPCKHGLGLLLLNARQPGLFAKGDMPAWVSDWINRRTEKEEKKTEKAEKPVDEVAQAKRREAREQKVSAGIEELLTWLQDIARNGILNMPEKSAAFWDTMARRMVDSQAPGLAGMVKSLAATPFWAEGWQSGFMDKLVQLYTVAVSYGHINSVSPLLQADIRSAIGFTQSQDELKQQEGVADTWLVLAKEVSDDGQLTTEYNWLHGLKTNRVALILQFYVRGQFAQLALTPGMYLNASLAFYPSTLPCRAIVKEGWQAVDAVEQAPQTYAGWQQVAEQETVLSSSLPFCNDMPVIVQQLKPVQYQKQWWLQDNAGCMCRISDDFKQLWRLLAISGGEPLSLAAVGRENSYRPIGVWQKNKYISI